LAEQHYQGAALAITERVQLGAHATVSASDTFGNTPFFKGLAAVLCAFEWGASIIN